jgi:hypothetical protein
LHFLAFICKLCFLAAWCRLSSQWRWKASLDQSSRMTSGGRSLPARIFLPFLA